jgi:hypothetical protein
MNRIVLIVSLALLSVFGVFASSAAQASNNPAKVSWEKTIVGSNAVAAVYSYKDAAILVAPNGNLQIMMDDKASGILETIYISSKDNGNTFASDRVCRDKASGQIPLPVVECGNSFFTPEYVEAAKSLPPKVQKLFIGFYGLGVGPYRHPDDPPVIKDRRP